MLLARDARKVPGGAALLGFASLTGLTALAGRRSTSRGGFPWFGELRKLPFQPPAWLFAPIWTFLYDLISASGWQLYRGKRRPRRRRALSLWAAQLGMNGLWARVFLRKRRPGAALVDCALFLGTAGAYLAAARGADRRAAHLFIPYVGWLAFATLLNAAIVRRNPLPR